MVIVLLKSSLLFSETIIFSLYIHISYIIFVFLHSLAQKQGVSTSAIEMSAICTDQTAKDVTKTTSNAVTFADVYCSCCKQLELPYDEDLLASLNDIQGHSLCLRGSGSLRPELPKLCIHDSSFIPLCDAIAKNATIFYLDLSYNQLSDQSIVILCRGLEVRYIVVMATRNNMNTIMIDLINHFQRYDFSSEFQEIRGWGSLFFVLFF